MMDHRFLIIVALLSNALPLWARSYPNSVEHEGTIFRTEIATDKFMYEPGETLHIRAVFNVAQDTLVVLRFPDAPVSDIGLYSPSLDSLVWYYAKWFEPSVQYIILSPQRPLVMEVNHYLPKTSTELPIQLIAIGSLGRLRFFPLSEIQYSMSPEAHPSYWAGRFWFLFTEPPPIIDSTEVDFDRSLDANADGVLDPTDFLLAADRWDRWTGWLSLPVDSTRVSVAVSVRRGDPDFSGNGVVDWDDFFLFAEYFGLSKGQLDYADGFDLNGNGKIDFPDFFRFADLFGKVY